MTVSVGERLRKSNFVRRAFQVAHFRARAPAVQRTAHCVAPCPTHPRAAFGGVPSRVLRMLFSIACSLGKIFPSKAWTAWRRAPNRLLGPASLYKDKDHIGSRSV